MATTKSLDVDSKVTTRLKGIDHRRIKRKKAVQRKIDKIASRLEGSQYVDSDRIEEWANEDLDALDFAGLESERFFDELAINADIPVTVTGTKWYSSDRRIGRIWKSIHESNVRNDTTTMLIFRNGDTTVYRLRLRSGQETPILSKAIHEGYILTRILVNYNDV